MLIVKVRISEISIPDIIMLTVGRIYILYILQRLGPPPVPVREGEGWLDLYCRDSLGS